MWNDQSCSCTTIPRSWNPSKMAMAVWLECPSGWEDSGRVARRTGAASDGVQLGAASGLSRGRGATRFPAHSAQALSIGGRLE